MERTTKKTLRELVYTLNDMAGKTAYQRLDNGSLVANIGVYVLDCAYGGYRLCQIVSKTAGERDITPRYGARVTADLIRAYMAGLSKREG